jgi:hypothetical protein
MPVLGEPGVAQTAYAHFVRAKELTNARSLESAVRARELFWLCIAEDPGFAAAWAWLGRCRRFIEKFGSEPSVNLELAKAAFLRALSIEAGLACAHHFYTQLQADCGEAREAMVTSLPEADLKWRGARSLRGTGSGIARPPIRPADKKFGGDREARF